MKTCSRCKEEKDESLFCKNRVTKDGLDYFCKICRRASTKKWQSENKEKIDEYNKTHPRDKAYMVAKATRWANANRDKVRACYKRHREVRVIYAQEYLEKNREIINKKKKESYDSDKIRHLTYATKSRFKRLSGIELTNELAETIVLISQTKQLCRTLNS